MTESFVNNPDKGVYNERGILVWALCSAILSTVLLGYDLYPSNVRLIMSYYLYSCYQYVCTSKLLFVKK